MSHKHPKSPEEWAALVGKSEAEATQAIKQAHPAVDVIPLSPGDCCIQDVNYSRVWLHLDEQGKVSRVPRLG